MLDFAQYLDALPVGEGAFPLIRLSSEDLAAASETQSGSTLAETEAAEAAAARIYINGSAAEEMPEYHDYLPAAVVDRIDRPRRRRRRMSTPSRQQATLMIIVSPQHHLTTGGNLTVNEAYIAANGVDADVILVGGDMVQIDVISQVNLAYTTAGAALATPLAQEHLSPVPPFPWI